jgi:superfamily II DNA or RNA helicase
MSCSKKNKAYCVGPDCFWEVGKGCRSARPKKIACTKKKKADCLSPCVWVKGKGCRSPEPKKVQKKSSPKRCSGKLKADCLVSPGCEWIKGKGCRKLQGSMQPTPTSLVADDCITRSKMKLKSIQEKAVRYFMDGGDDLLVVFGTGVGKTLTAVVISQCYLDTYKNNSVLVVSPKSLLTNFKKELLNYGQDDFSRYEFVTYGMFQRKVNANRGLCSNKMVIFDEVHTIRTKKSKGYEAGVLCTEVAHKRLLLTATPFVNSEKDLISLATLLNGSPQIDWELGLRNKVIYYPKVITKDFPSFEEKDVFLAMSEAYKEQYLRAIADRGYIFQGNPETFYTGFRRAVNMLQDKDHVSKKADFILKVIRSDRSKQSLIVSQWIEYGVTWIKELLEENGIKCSLISGNVKNRDEEVKKFNARQTQVMIITKAGSEGLDLKNVENVFIVDPPWNDASVQQAIGRAIRYKSHEALPPNRRHVVIYYLILVQNPDFNWGWTDDDPPELSGDVILYNFVREKRQKEQEIGRILNKISI